MNLMERRIFLKYDRNSNLNLHMYILKIPEIESTPSEGVFERGEYHWTEYPSGMERKIKR